MSKVGQHASMAEQLAELATVVDAAAKEGGEQASAIAEKGRRILALARELAADVGDATRQAVTTGSRRVQDTAEHEMEVARDFVRQYPLAAVAGVAALAAALAVLAMSATRR